jgi:putative copper resistance protein D
LEALLVVSRLCHYLAAMILCGSLSTVGYLVAPLPPASQKRVYSRLLQVHRLAVVTALVSAILWLIAVAGGIGDGWNDALNPAFVGMVLADTAFGAIWRWRLLLYGLIAALMLMRPPAGVFLASLVTVGLVTIALTGHSAANAGMSGILQGSFDAIHLVTGAVWIGGLVPLILALGIPEGIRRTVNRFSMIASLAVFLVVASGTINAWFLIGSPRDLVTTTYGQLLSLKVILVALMVILAVLNRFWITPRYSRDPVRAARHLRITIGLELALALIVLVLVAVFGTMSPPEHGTGASS